MWADNETTQDLLGFKVHANLIRSVVIDPKLLPVTIGIFGDWGGGKTSIMKMIQKDLDPDNYNDKKEKDKYSKIVCLYFNGWLFEGYDDAKSAILASILLQLGEHKTIGPKIRNTVVSLLKSVNWMRLASFGFKEVALPAIMAYSTGGASLIPSFLNSIKTIIDKVIPSIDKTKVGKDEEDKVKWVEFIKADKTPGGPMGVRAFRENFEKMLEDSDITSLVVLIDDLDRCSPERIIDNLEAIKLFLNVKRTAFIIGADPRIVRHAIANRYKTYENSEQKNQGNEEDTLIKDYLEKLIQIPYCLPKLSPTEIETYMVLLFCSQHLDEEKMKKCLNFCEKQKNENRYSVFGYASVKNILGEINIPEQLSHSLTFSSHIAPLITEGLKGNPRQVKRFLNAFILRKKLAEVAKLKHIRDDVLVKLMVLEYVHPLDFQILFNWQASKQGYPEEIKKLEEILLPRKDNLDTEETANVAKEVNESWSKLPLRKWIVMEPRLSDIDLRDYFWIARDRLQSTFPGLSMVAPIVRSLFNDLISGNSGNINQTIQTAIQELKNDEKVSLLELLVQHIQRHSNDKSGYDILRNLIERDFPGSAEKFNQILLNVPPENIPPAVGIDIFTLIQNKNELGKIFEPSLDKLEQTKTMIGRAIKQNRKK